ncbi:hypothetical protein [Lignipirellula cremea]|nr:hypothetical protein [Lignipirellula cremea]
MPCALAADLMEADCQFRECDRKPEEVRAIRRQHRQPERQVANLATCD